MKDFFAWLVVILGLILLILFALTNYNESAASKDYAQGQARAMIIEAQSQARQDFAVIALPYVSIAVVTVFGGAILILAVVILRQKRDAKVIERIETRIETRYILLLPQGSKREVYKLLSDRVRLLD